MGRVNYGFSDGIATITLDDGKANALSPDMQAEIHSAIDQAQADDAIIVLTGRDGMFSGGFDLKIIAAGGQQTMDMVKGGFLLAERLYAYEKPVVVAVSGHAIAMAAFLLLCADYRIGARGDFRIIANEVAIGLPMPQAAIEITRQRLTPAHLHRAMNLSQLYTPDTAVEAGWLDEVVAPHELMNVAHAKATEFSALNMNAHKITKQKMRAQSAAAIRAAVEAEFGA